MTEQSHIFMSPVGELFLKQQNGCLVSVDMNTKTCATESEQGKIDNKIIKQLQEYFDGQRTQFSLPIKLMGTEFQRKVWQEMQKIPHGETCSYSDIAKKINSSPRAVGNACRANPIPVIVPCHRVVAKTGLGGYCGETVGRFIDTKQWLLRHEGVAS
ncbi:MAG: methylated-DNA--[protein]-cysteine S-methyltransferase [Gammaproteobacteria bacterium]|nr:methylated-DNA--[protein]-cysteine S-methyltransferase [Gammaproteobacteria bacterium]